MISRHLPKRTSTCCFIGMKPSMKSAIGGDAMRSSASGVVSISSCAASIAGVYWPRNIAP